MLSYFPNPLETSPTALASPNRLKRRTNRWFLFSHHSIGIDAYIIGHALQTTTLGIPDLHWRQHHWIKSRARWISDWHQNHHFVYPWPVKLLILGDLWSDISLATQMHVNPAFDLVSWCLISVFDHSFSIILFSSFGCHGSLSMAQLLFGIDDIL